jgi:hypothetical protein
MDFDADDLDAEENDFYSGYTPSEYAWIYIVIDIRDMNLSKIGLTTKKSPLARVSEGKTYNPFLMLFATYELSKCTYGVSSKELSDIERYIHDRFVFGNPIRHLYTRGKSEWFYIPPQHAESQIDWIIAKRNFSVDGKKLFTFYEGDHNHGGIHVPRMRKIKKIYRPLPDDFRATAEASGIDFHYYAEFYNFLIDYHAQSPAEKIYL